MLNLNIFVLLEWEKRSRKQDRQKVSRNNEIQQKKYCMNVLYKIIVLKWDKLSETFKFPPFQSLALCLLIFFVWLLCDDCHDFVFAITRIMIKCPSLLLDSYLICFFISIFARLNTKETHTSISDTNTHTYARLRTNSSVQFGWTLEYSTYVHFKVLVCTLLPLSASPSPPLTHSLLQN